MKLQQYVYNTETQKMEKFEPWNGSQVKMYCCGPTVYDFLHIGNFRGAIFYNFVRNWLEHLGYKVTYVYNYTDVDDKIINRAAADGVTSQQVAEKYIAEFEKDFKALGLRDHDFNPRVSAFINPIIKMIQTLIDNGHAYAVDGEVLFKVKAFAPYGKLSHRDPEDMRSGYRIEVKENKQDPLDFALWKPQKDKSEPAWPSPWGLGRPGWHIECSAMASEILGPQIDIHGGGLDLIFPHHENEIAQSESCSGKHYVKYWLHNNMLNFSGAKMSKSLGNILTGRAFLEKYDAEILKYMMLSVHYRSVTDFGEAAVSQCVSSLARIYSALGVAEAIAKEAGVDLYLGNKNPNDNLARLAGVLDINTELDVMKPLAGLYSAEIRKKYLQDWLKMQQAYCDDFSTPQAFAIVFEKVREFNSKFKRGMKPNPKILSECFHFVQFVVQDFGFMMSLFQQRPSEFLTALDDLLLENMKLKRSDVQALVDERMQARANKDFAKSDELRAKINAMGISVSDTPQGSFWEVTK